MRGVRVLITCHRLESIGGVQAYVRDLAVGLLAGGHQPVVYAPVLGRAANQLASDTVAVTNDLATIGATPDVIVGNASLETLVALLHFPDTPGIYIRHSWREPVPSPRFPRLLHYIAVDDTCADRLRFQDGISPEQMTILLNAVDLERFRARSTPLPPRPRRALVFGNAAHGSRHAGIIEDVCREEGLPLDIVGELAGTATNEPETILQNYDLVFAKARCALEAAASGAAVVVAEGRGFGGLVTSENVARLRRLNFGIRSINQPLTREAVRGAIASYDPVDAARVAEFIRGSASLIPLQQQIVELCAAVVQEFATMPRPSREEEGRAAAVFLQAQGKALLAPMAQVNLLIQAAHRVMQAPVVGPMLARGARWLVNRGSVSGKR